ncbi:chemotaxis protein [Rhizobium sp. JAB6]|uniref:chemotaxis protein MotC n=1 Tax=Rhizobium sp. JAB6 TaxID=2127050 RepID=UPI000D12293D|nr:chemotaxis protein MotC [Rhizobium sp. JAB6]PST23499.1 chemotaxis protein [Rhizobium sp. JAB6]
MARKQHRHRLALTLTLGMLMPGVAGAEGQDGLPLYKMLRSLEFVQDSVVAGDSSAAEMQRFLLGTIDERLRSADKSVFEDNRNVDAALIYAMSGGNPETLEYLMSRDVNGNFDNRVADVLRKYLNGKGLLVVNTLADIAKEYRGKPIGPYLSLVAGNVMSGKNAKAALQLYDWARLMAPGTIVEESALRRSLALCADAGMVPQGLDYARRYTRRFLHSPYASQFADLSVQLVVDHDSDVKQQDIVDILSFMDPPRQREIYLRMARRAAIAGKADLAALAADRAQAISNDGGDAFGALANFYGGVAGISTPELKAAINDVNQMPAGELNARDRALRDAAKAVAAEILRTPDAASLGQGSVPNLPNQRKTEHDAAVTNQAGGQSPGTAGVEQGAPANAAPAPEGGRQEADSSFNAFVTTSRSKLEAIDGLLKQESH